MCKKLSDVAEYVDTKIEISEVNLINYVSTDNLLLNKQGKSVADILPASTSKVTKYSKNDVLVANIRPYLKKIWFADQSGGNSADVLTFRAKKNVSPKFLYYALFRDDFFAHMMRGAKGTKMPRGDKDQILKFPVPDFDSEKQEEIGQILSVIDSKIEVNRKLYYELEALIKLIYDYWFMQFEFPDAQGKPYKSSGGRMEYNHKIKQDIPYGWNVATLETIANISTGKLDSNAEVTGGEYPFYTCAKDCVEIDSYSFDDDVILIAGNNAQGNFHVNRYSGKFDAYQRTYVVTAKEQKYLNYLYEVLSKQMVIYKHRGSGSQTKFLTLGMLTDIHINQPNTDLMNKFQDATHSFYLKQMEIVKENKRLSSFRDWLLPMLMNGQVTVKGA